MRKINPFFYRELTAEEYKTLYPKYLTDPAKLLDLAGDLTDKNILDLCGGGGRLSIKALEYGAKCCTLVDISKSMTNDVPDNIKVITRDLSDESCKTLLPISHVAFCQGGINYWFNPTLVKVIHDSLHNDGLFIFNTFNSKPQHSRPISYEMNARSYQEANIIYESEPNKINHYQCNNESFHINQFWWIPRDEFVEVLKPYFNIEIRTNEKTDYYICKRKNTLTIQNKDDII